LNSVTGQTTSFVLCIVGPTATGKSELGIELAKLLDGEVVSADSMQVYRKMDIGTAKLTVDEMEGIPHHLLDIVEPDQPFTVADWVENADRVIQDIQQRQKLPIVVGGTGLYIRSIVEDLEFGRHSGLEEVRQKWEDYADRYGNLALHNALSERDASSANRLHPNDRRRLIRALEISELGEPMSDNYDWRVKGGRHRTFQIGLSMQRELLYKRVNQRVDKMVKNGLYQEVDGLLNQGYHRHLNAMQAIGYKEVAAAIAGEVSLETAIDDVKRATRRFAKRQLSWFRRDPRIHWYEKSERQDSVTLQFDSILADVKASIEGIHVQGLE
jgi:tRNA dimethylallyltransferase